MWVPPGRRRRSAAAEAPGHGDAGTPLPHHRLLGRPAVAQEPLLGPADLDEALRGVEGPVPGHVAVGDERQFVVTGGPGPRHGTAQEGAANALAAVAGMDRELLEVGAAVDPVHAAEADR